MNIEFTFHNRCQGHSAPTVVLFQRGSDVAQFAVAWKVIRNCAPGWHHPFTYSTTPQVNVSDADGNHSPPLDTAGGAMFEATPHVPMVGFTRHIGGP